MNSFSFSYLVLYLTVIYQVECKRHHKTGEVDQFRRLYEQIRPPPSLTAQHLSRLSRLTTKPVVSFEVFTNKDTHIVDEANSQVIVKVEKPIKKQELLKNTQQSVKEAPKQIQKNVKPVLDTSKMLKSRISQGLRDAKKLLRKPKELDEETKKAIRARYFQREREDVLDIERQKVEELKQKVLKMRKDMKNKNPKNKAKQLYLMNGNEGKFKPVVRSNQGYHEMRKSAKHMRKRAKLTATTPTPLKSRFFVQTNTEKTTGRSASSPKVTKSPVSSSSNDEQPVMRGVKDLDDADDDEDDDLNFDLEGELLSHIIM